LRKEDVNFSGKEEDHTVFAIERKSRYRRSLAIEKSMKTSAEKSVKIQEFQNSKTDCPFLERGRSASNMSHK
jgi:hypothetical protein